MVMVNYNVQLEGIQGFTQGHFSKVDVYQKKRARTEVIQLNESLFNH